MDSRESKGIDMGYRSQVGYVIEFKSHNTVVHDTVVHDTTQISKADEAEADADKEYAKSLFYMFIAETKAKQQTTLAWDDEVIDGKYVKTGEAISKWGLILEVDYTNQLIKFRAEDVKWYDSYPDVDCHNAMIDTARDYCADEANDEETNERQIFSLINERQNRDYMSYTFIRIGEEANDVECMEGGTGETNSYLYPVSSIQWDIFKP
jgi:hypothetical protein